VCPPGIFPSFSDSSISVEFLAPRCHRVGSPSYSTPSKRAREANRAAFSDSLEPSSSFHYSVPVLHGYEREPMTVFDAAGAWRLPRHSFVSHFALQILRAFFEEQARRETRWSPCTFRRVRVFSPPFYVGNLSVLGI